MTGSGCVRSRTAWKTLRYDATRSIYIRRRQRDGDIALPQRIRGRRVLVTVGYGDPEAIDMQAAAVARFVPGALYVVADNSADDAVAREIAAIAGRHGAPYVRLPQPLLLEEGSRSHGLALDWMWRNVIRPGAPEAFGFLDDDLFPTAPDDPFAMLRQQPVYGALRTAGRALVSVGRVLLLPVRRGQGPQAQFRPGLVQGARHRRRQLDRAVFPARSRGPGVRAAALRAVPSRRRSGARLDSMVRPVAA